MWDYRKEHFSSKSKATIPRIRPFDKIKISFDKIKIPMRVDPSSSQLETSRI